MCMAAVLVLSPVARCGCVVVYVDIGVVVSGGGSYGVSGFGVAIGAVCVGVDGGVGGDAVVCVDDDDGVGVGVDVDGVDCGVVVVIAGMCCVIAVGVVVVLDSCWCGLWCWCCWCCCW